MNKLVLLAAFLLLSASAFAQKATITAVVADETTKEPLEHATVAVQNIADSSLLTYTITPKNGVFKLLGIPVKGAKLLITYVGYESYRKILVLKPGVTNDLGKIYLTGKSLDEIKIKGERPPIVIRKDTIEFNAEAFKTRPNAVVEDLLRLLPGVQVNYDGTITMQGKTVSKLKIDNKLFFGNDPKVASKNLDADMIDKVEVYDDREDDPDHKLTDDQVNKIINLKMKKKIRKSTLGKVYAGVGTRDRYEAGGIISTFRDTLQVSLIGLMNNLSKTGFSSQDLYSMGGFNRSGGNQAWDGTFGRGWGGGIESIASGGLNINNDYGDKLKMNLTYFYSNNSMVYDSRSSGEQKLENTVLGSNSQSVSKNNDQKHALTGYLRWKPDTIHQLTFEPRLDLTKGYNTYNSSGVSFNTQSPKLTESYNAGVTDSRGVNYSHNLNYYRRFHRKGRSISISNSISLNERKSNSYNINDLNSFTSTIVDQRIDRFNDRPSTTNNVGLSVNYFHQWLDNKTTTISTDFYVNTRYFTDAETNLLYDRDTVSLLYDRYLPDQSSDLRRENFINNFKTQLTYRIRKVTFKFGLDAEHQDVKNIFNNAAATDMRKGYWYLFPSFNFNLDAKGHYVSLSYTQYVNLPRISQMQPVTRIYSQLYRSTGNPDLLPGKAHRLYANYYKYYHDKQLNTSFYSGLTITENAVVNIQTIDTIGATTSSYVNRRGNISLYGGGSFGKQFKKTKNWQVGLNGSFNINYDRSAFFLNKKEGIQNQYYISANETVSFNYKSIWSFNTKYSAVLNRTNYKEIDANTINTLTHNVGSDLTLRWPKRMIFDVNYNYRYNPQVADGFPKSSHILNLAATLLMLKKDRGQIKLQVYDVLDQNISVNRWAYQNSVTTNEQQILRRYFMLTYQIKLNSFK